MAYKADLSQFKDVGNLTSAAELAREMGMGQRADRLEQLARRHGGQTGGLPGSTSTLPSLQGEFDPNDYRGAVKTLAALAQRTTANRGNSRQVGRNVRAEAKDFLSEQYKAQHLKANENRWATDYQPTFDKSLSSLNDLAGKALVSGEQENALRSQIGASYQSAANSSLNRVAAILGQRGQMDSPAGAAIAQRMSNEFDSKMIGQLTQMSLDVNQMNQSAQGQRAQAAAQMAGYSMASRDAFLKDDYSEVAKIGEKMAELSDALYTSNLTFSLYEQQMKDAKRAAEGDWMDQVGKFGSMLSAFPQFSFMGMGTTPGKAMPNPGAGSPAPSGGIAPSSLSSYSGAEKLMPVQNYANNMGGGGY